MSDVLHDDATTPPGKRRLGPILLVVLLIAVVLGLWLAWRSPADQIQGMADADTINVAAKITARVAELKVREGDRVQAGQVLFLLDSPEVAAKEQQAHGALAAAQAVADKADEGARSEDIRAAEANWKRAEAGATLAEATYQRVQNLFNEGVMTRQKRDEAQAQATSSRELARAARAQYDMALAGAREQDKRAAQGQVQQAQGAVLFLGNVLAYTRVDVYVQPCQRRDILLRRLVFQFPADRVHVEIQVLDALALLDPLGRIDPSRGHERGRLDLAIRDNRSKHPMSSRAPLLQELDGGTGVVLDLWLHPQRPPR